MRKKSQNIVGIELEVETKDQLGDALQGFPIVTGEADLIEHCVVGNN